MVRLRRERERRVLRARPISDVGRGGPIARRPVVVARVRHGATAGRRARGARVVDIVEAMGMSVGNEDENILLVRVSGGRASVALDHALSGEVVLDLLTEDGDIVVLLKQNNERQGQQSVYIWRNGTWCSDGWRCVVK